MERPKTVLVEQAASLLGVSRRTVYYRIREGRLETIRTRCGSQRITVASIDRLLEEKRDAVAARGKGRSETEPLTL